MYKKAYDLYACKEYDHAFKLLLKNAETLDHNGQYLLGHMYLKGDVELNYNSAREWFLKCALSDIYSESKTYAQYEIGIMYFYGRGVQVNYKETVKWLQKSANESMNRLTELYFNTAQCNLGHMYQHGLGVEKNYTKAVKLYKKSVDQDHCWGKYRLGCMYEKGLGVKKDYIKAAKLYKRSIKQDPVVAGNNLSYILKRASLQNKKDFNKINDVLGGIYNFPQTVEQQLEMEDRYYTRLVYKIMYNHFIIDPYIPKVLLDLIVFYL
jgi:TPR repeat protein